MGKVYKYIHISLHKRKIRSLHDLKILKPDPKLLNQKKPVAITHTIMSPMKCYKRLTNSIYKVYSRYMYVQVSAE